MKKSIILFTHLLFSIIILLSISIITTSTTAECFKQILHFTQIYAKNQTKFFLQMGPYLIFSGKTIDDLGLPSQCLQHQHQAYTTVEINFDTPQFYYQTYYGFCFTDACSADDLNAFGKMIIDDIFNGTLDSTATVNFVTPQFQTQSNPLAVILYIVFSIIIALGFVYSGKKWIRQCKSQDQEQQQVDEDQINLSSRYNIMLDDDNQPKQVPRSLQVKFSLQKKFQQLQQKQQSDKILSFSVFKLIAVPWLIVGQMFYLMNFASYNYFAFANQIYDTLFSSFAVAAYFLPDIFFFISAFLFTKKLVKYETNKQSLAPFIFQALKKKFLRLYPLYIAVILIYWFISPTLHSGPVWYVYQQQAQTCNTAWWRAIILIDNWFVHGCYQPGWFIQAQLQLVLLNIFLMFCYFKKPKTTIGLISLVLLVFTVLMYTISGPLPSSVQTMISHQTSNYFRSTYAHAPFYVFGIMFGIAHDQESSFYNLMKNKVVKRKIILNTLMILGFVIAAIVIWHPSVWEGVLGFQLGICRAGFFIGVLPFFLHGMYNQQVHQSRVHRFAQLSYPIILCSGIVTMSSFWCYETFPYVSGSDVMRGLIPSFFISVSFGGLLSLILGFTKPIYR